MMSRARELVFPPSTIGWSHGLWIWKATTAASRSGLLGSRVERMVTGRVVMAWGPPEGGISTGVKSLSPPALTGASM